MTIFGAKFSGCWYLRPVLCQNLLTVQLNTKSEFPKLTDCTPQSAKRTEREQSKIILDILRTRI